MLSLVTPNAWWVFYKSRLTQDDDQMRIHTKVPNECLWKHLWVSATLYCHATRLLTDNQGSTNPFIWNPIIWRFGQILVQVFPSCLSCQTLSVVDVLLGLLRQSLYVDLVSKKAQRLRPWNMTIQRTWYAQDISEPILVGQCLCTNPPSASGNQPPTIDSFTIYIHMPNGRYVAFGLYSSLPLGKCSLEIQGYKIR